MTEKPTLSYNFRMLAFTSYVAELIIWTHNTNHKSRYDPVLCTIKGFTERITLLYEQGAGIERIGEIREALVEVGKDMCCVTTKAY